MEQRVNSGSVFGEQKVLAGVDFDAVRNVSVVKRGGERVVCSLQKVYTTLQRLAHDLPAVSLDGVIRAIVAQLYDGITTQDLEEVMILSIVPFVEQDPEYGFLAARVLLQKLSKLVIGQSYNDEKIESLYRTSFVDAINKGVASNLFDKRLLDFNLPFLASHLVIERDLKLGYNGVQILSDKYLRKVDGQYIELPQSFWMRVAMGLCILEPHKNERAIEFYNQLSTFRSMSSTPTLLHSGLTRPQLSSCYLTTIADDLPNIFKSYADNAQMSKWSGGIGNDWSNIRAIGATIKSLDMPSQGLVPFLKIANEVTSTISRSGSRRGATVAYLEVWHAEIEDFLDLRRNTGDERRRTHDMNTAAWIPDLFMKRVLENGNWSLFSPHEVPDLHDLYGKKFEEAYEGYEVLGEQGNLETYRTVPAKDLWRKMLTRLFETGHPWLAFKDPCNIRSPQDHDGVVHSSNLCTEITLNTSITETAVCNLASINLAEHVQNGVVEYGKLAQSIKTAIRMLDNVVDINFYPTIEGQNSNLKHRPIGMGIMGLQDAMFKLDINFESSQALEFSDSIMEFISYHAILSSSELAAERGAYQTFKGSKWDRGILPLDTLELLEHERGISIDVNRKSTLDWNSVREAIAKYGMRNSNTMAVAPTATISNIVGCFPCIEPQYKNMYVKANMCGEFTITNTYLVEDLKKLGLWTEEIREQIKYFDGSIQRIAAIPQQLKNKYKEAFELDAEWMVQLTAVRGKWIDQSQSHNVFLANPSGKALSDVYMAGWKAGLKTFYYLRTMGATQIEKSTLDAAKYGFTQTRTYEVSVDAVAASKVAAVTTAEKDAFCRIEDPSCESCQ